MFHNFQRFCRVAENPFAGCAARNDPGLSVIDFCQRESLPVAEIHFHQEGIGTVAIGIPLHPGPYALHRFPGPPQRAGNKVKPVRGCDQRAEAIAITVGLTASVNINVDVHLPLNPTFDVPVGLAVPGKSRRVGGTHYAPLAQVD